jgi:hypothetical protein
MMGLQVALPSHTLRSRNISSRTQKDRSSSLLPLSEVVCSDFEACASAMSVATYNALAYFAPGIRHCDRRPYASAPANRRSLAETLDKIHFF